MMLQRRARLVRPLTRLRAVAFTDKAPDEDGEHDPGMQSDVCSVGRKGKWTFFKGSNDAWHERPTFVRELGRGVLNNPLYNKGTAFVRSERERFHIRGLLPPRILSMEDQASRTMKEFRMGIWDQAARDPTDEMVKAGLLPDNIRKWRYISGIQDINETLFYRLLIDNFQEMAPIIYTPTCGWACLHFSVLYKRARGMFFSSTDVGHMMSMVYNWPNHEVDAIVVTDGSRILGLGDLGMNGMGISIGKLDLYVAAAGFHKARVLPCVIDVGTNNEKLRQSQDYLGLAQPRIEGEEYLRIVDEFIAAVKSRWPRVLIQFEDFRTEVAKPLLERYRHDHLCFNDDIQGTACTALAGVYGALAVQGLPYSAIKDMRLVVCGAGSAGMGVVEWLTEAMVKHGRTIEQARAQFWVIDKDGLITRKRDNLPAHVAAFARPEADDEGINITAVIRKVQPLALLGLSGAGRIWEPEALRALADGVPADRRPLVFPMSNPTSRSECSAEDAAIYTDGRAIFASGSPFQNVKFGEQLFVANQSNNLLIFPGLALGAKLCQARVISDAMLMAASEALANANDPSREKAGYIYPSLKNIRAVSAQVAAAVFQSAVADGLATNDETLAAWDTAGGTREGLLRIIQNNMYEPVYSPLVYVPPGVLE